VSKLAGAASAGHFQVQEVTGGVPALSLMQLSEVITVGRNRKALPDSQFSIELGAHGQGAALFNSSHCCRRGARELERNIRPDLG